MDSHLKHRLVGALVVISLAVIVSPLLFDFTGSNRIDRSSQVPPKPDTLPELLSLEEPQRIDNVPVADESPFVPDPEPLEVESADAEPAVTQPEEAGAAGDLLADTDAPVLDDEGLPNAWVIQVGAFSELAKAESFRDELIGRGWKAYSVRPIPGSDGLFRVFVGPFVDAEQANRSKAELDEQLQTRTLLSKFAP